MYTKTEKILEIQQTGTDEYKSIVELRPASPAGAFRITAYVEGREDGSPGNISLTNYDAMLSSDGTYISAVAVYDDDHQEVGTVAWRSDVVQDGSSGPLIFGVLGSYGTEAAKPSGTYTVNWKIRVVFEEWD